MNCEQISERLTELVVGELPAAEKATFEDHITACASCLSELESIRATVGLLSDMDWVDEAPGVDIDSLVAAAAGPTRSHWFRRRQPLIAAAVMVIGVGSAVFLLQTRPHTEPAGLSARQAEATSPADIGSIDADADPTDASLDEEIADGPEVAKLASDPAVDAASSRTSSAAEDQPTSFEASPGSRLGNNASDDKNISAAGSAQAGEPAPSAAQPSAAQPSAAQPQVAVRDELQTLGYLAETGSKRSDETSRVAKAPAEERAGQESSETRSAPTERVTRLGGRDVTGKTDSRFASPRDGRVDRVALEDVASPPPASTSTSLTERQRSRPAVQAEGAPPRRSSPPGLDASLLDGEPSPALAREEKARRLEPDAITVAPRKKEKSKAPPVELEEDAFDDHADRDDRGMRFKDRPVSPFVSTRNDRYSTFGLDVDTASYTIARSYLDRGRLPPTAAIRVEEFVNALPYSDPAPTQDAFSLTLDVAPHPFERHLDVLRIGLKAREIGAEQRRPTNLVFLVDVSGSMRRGGRLGLVQTAIMDVVERLDERDRVAVLSYSTKARTILPMTAAEDTSSIRRAVTGLVAGGHTDVSVGLEAAYDLAVRSFDRHVTNRVVLLSDGVANAGTTNPDQLIARIRSQAQKSIYLTTIGVGMGDYNDELLQRLADEGDGWYAYVDTDEEARSVFGDLGSSFEVVARDAKIQVEFDRSNVRRWRLLGYEKRDIADADFRANSVDAGELNAGHAVTALYEIERAGPGPIGLVSIRWEDPRSARINEFNEPIRPTTREARFDQAGDDLRLAFLAARFAEHLRRSPWLGDEDLGDIRDGLESLPRRTRRRAEVRELIDMVDRAARLSTRR